MSMYEPQTIELFEKQVELEGAELDFARTFISAVKWQVAKSVPANPHAYCVRSWLRDQEEQWFDQFRGLIKQKGYAGRFLHQNYTYINVDGYRYWESRSFIGDRGPILNRCRTDANMVDDESCCALAKATGGKHHAKDCRNLA